MAIFGCFVLRKVRCNLTLLPFRCGIPSYAWNLWRMLRLWTTRHLTVHAFLSKFSRQFEDVFSWNFLVFSHFAKNESIDTGQIQDVVKNSNWPPTSTRFHRVRPSNLVCTTFSLAIIKHSFWLFFSCIETLADIRTELMIRPF